MLDGLSRENGESEQTNGGSTEATASTRAMPSPGAVSIETPTARLETELSHLPNLYTSLVEEEPDHRIITRLRFPPPTTEVPPPRLFASVISPS